MPKAACFPHADDQFDTPANLMDWLEHDLRTTHRGYYRYRKAQGLGKLEPGSIIFFYKNGLIVGSAVVERNSRSLEPSEKERCSEIHNSPHEEVDHCSGMENIVKFFTESIWVWSEQELVSKDEFYRITGKDLTHYVTIEPSHVLKLYEIVANKSVKMDTKS